MVNGINNILPTSPFGSVQRLGFSENGRVLYNVVDSNGKSAGKLTVPFNEADTFENAYNDILESAPKIQEYVTTHSKEDTLSKRKAVSQALITTGGVIGFGLPVMFSKSKSALKNILMTGTGVIIGVLSGFVAAYVTTLPPGTIQFAKASRKIGKLDIQSVKDN